MAPNSLALYRRAIRLLQYLSKSLLAESHQEVLDSTQVLLQLCTRLGACINLEEFLLQLAQRMVLLGEVIQSSLLKAFLMQARVGNFLTLKQVRESREQVESHAQGPEFSSFGSRES